jgi:hypothetical protein
MNLYLYKRLKLNILKRNLFQGAIIRTVTAAGFILCALNIQAQSVVNIKVNATVPDMSEMDIIVVNSLVIDDTKSVNGKLNVSPNLDAEAGMIKIKGSPKAKFSIIFLDFIELGQTNGEGSLRFKFKLSGFPKENQQASQLMDPLIRELTFSENGEYFLWIGGEMNYSGILPGNYEGIFAFEIEYL